MEPRYGDGVDLVLDKLENDVERRALWDAVADAIDLICDYPDGAQARRYSMRLQSGKIVWRVPVRVGSENDDWCVIWSPDGEDAVIRYIGLWPLLR